MTDEEMAEEYAEKRRFKSIDDNSDIVMSQNKWLETLKQAFLAGLKAGRPKWYKVADGDLPKENKLYLVAIKDNGLAIAYFNGRYWETKYNLGDFGHCVETVIAWCEIPKYTEE